MHIDLLPLLQELQWLLQELQWPLQQQGRLLRLLPCLLQCLLQLLQLWQCIAKLQQVAHPLFHLLHKLLQWLLQESAALVKGRILQLLLGVQPLLLVQPPLWQPEGQWLQHVQQQLAAMVLQL